MQSSFIDKYVKNQKNNLKFSEVQLPQGSLLFPDKLPKQVRVYPLTVGKEMNLFESFIQILEEDKILKKFQIYDILMDDIVSPQGSNDKFDINKLTSFDMEFILYNMRVLSNGQEIKLDLTCPNCWEFKNDQLKLSEELKEKGTDESIIDDELKKKQEEYGITNFNKQSMSKQDFQQMEHKMSIQKPEMEMPNKPKELEKNVELKSGMKLKISLPTLGQFRQLKGYISDFRHMLIELYDKHGLEYNEDKIEDEYEMFLNFVNISLYIHKINNDNVTFETMPEIPVTLKNIIMRGDMNKITQQIEELVSKFSLKLPYKTKCQRCGYEVSGDVSNMFRQYLFGTNI